MAERSLGNPLEGTGRLGNTSTWGSDRPFDLTNNILSITIGILTSLAGVWFLFVTITGAISYMQAGGDQAKIEAARKRLTNGVIGLVIVIGAIFLAEFVGNLLGFDILNPGEYLLSISP